MTERVVCDVLLFVAYFLIVVFSVYSLVVLPRKLNVVIGNEANLSQSELTSKCRRLYVKKFFVLLVCHLCALAFDGSMCLSDGMSDTESGLVLPVWIFVSFSLALVIFSAVYSALMRKRYKIITSPSDNPLGNCRRNAPIDLLVSILISFVFSFNSAIVAYTIWLISI